MKTLLQELALTCAVTLLVGILLMASALAWQAPATKDNGVTELRADNAVTELWAETLVAQSTEPTIGGRVLKDDAAPAVTELMQTQFVVAVQAKELWNLKAYQAQTEYQKAADALDKLLATWAKPGYDLKLTPDQKLEYVKKKAGGQ